MGASVQDAELAKHIWKRYAFRAVAMLELEDTEDDYISGKRKKDAAARNYSFQLQKRDPMFFNGKSLHRLYPNFSVNTNSTRPSR